MNRHGEQYARSSRTCDESTYTVLTSYEYRRRIYLSIHDAPSVRLFIGTHQSPRSCHLAQPSPHRNTPKRPGTLLYTLLFIVNLTMGQFMPAEGCRYERADEACIPSLREVRMRVTLLQYEDHLYV